MGLYPIMDFRVAALMQIWNGHKFTPPQLARLLAPDANMADAASVLSALDGHPLARCPQGWLLEAERILNRASAQGIRWSYPGCWDYPELWERLKSPRPLVFSYQGEPVWTKLYTISVVGSRTPARETCLWMQRELTRFLRDSEFSIVSGGARGVDQWSHRLSVDVGRPTVCIFPSGLFRPYPREEGALYRRILDGGGALVSTFALDQDMRRHLFVIRNRWIAGLSGLTFVVEANRRSGSSLTAKHAWEENRNLCTLPMSPLSETGLGNLDLIAEDKAALIRDGLDLISRARASKTVWGGVMSTNS